MMRSSISEESKEAFSMKGSITQAINQTFLPTPMNAIKQTKQRAVYSEVLMKSQEPTLLSAPTNKPSNPSRNHTNALPIISANSFRGSRLKLDSIIVPSLDRLLDDKPAYLHQSNNPSPSMKPPHLSVLEPKVMVPFVHNDTKAPPRRIAVERKKRAFINQSVNQLLLERGIDFQRYSPSHDQATGQTVGQLMFLPLEMFDDWEFDPYSPEAMMSSSESRPSSSSSSNNEQSNNQSNHRTSTKNPVPAQGLRLDVHGHGSYHKCVVEAFTQSFNSITNKSINQCTIRFLDTGIHTQTPRLFVKFDSEDPVNYCNRLLFAFQSRRYVEKQLAINLSIDLMPDDSLRKIDSESINRMVFAALNSKKLRLSAVDTGSAVNEVQLEYARACNAIIFDARARQSIDQSLVTSINHLTPYRGPQQSKVVPAHNFAQHFTDFCFHSLYTQGEAIAALTSVNLECQKMEALSLFITSYAKSVRIEEFESTQINSMNATSTAVRDKLQSINQSIRASLKDCDKGWLNLAEGNRQIYEYSKLKRLMLLINLFVTSSVRTCVQKSTLKFVNLIESACDFRVRITDKKDVVVRRGRDDNTPIESDAVNLLSLSAPLFAVDLLFKDGSIMYSTPPSTFCESVLNLFDSSFVCLDHLPHIESLTLPHLFPPNHAYLAAISGDEPLMRSHRDCIQTNLEYALEPMNVFIQLFTPYFDLLTLNVDEHVKQFNRDHEGDLEAMKRELTTQTILRETVEQSIPRSTNLGVVIVNCEDLKRKVLNKHTELLTKQLDSLSRWCRTRCDEVVRTSSKIESELRALPLDIPALMKLKEWLLSVPASIHLLRGQISEILTYFDALDAFQYKASRELAKLRWTVFSTPKSLNDCLLAREAALATDSANFLSEMRSLQEEFDTELHECEKRTTQLAHAHDLSDLPRLTEKVERLHTVYQSLIQRSQLFNANELLLGVMLTDYAHLTPLGEMLEANYLLLTTASQWGAAHAKWRQGPFIELNAVQIDSAVKEYTHRLDRCAQSKVVRENTAHSSLLAQLRAEIEAFLPVMPLILALRNEGMQARHWKSVADLLPFELDLTDDMLTLTRLLDEYQLQQYLEPISAISQLASQEFSIESSLLEMEEHWRGREFVMVPYQTSNTFIVQSCDEIQTKLVEHIAQTAKMSESPHRALFNDRINKWAAKMSTSSLAIAAWLDAQERWTSVEPEFANADLVHALPVEAKKFAAITKSWRSMMAQAHANPDVLAFADSTALLTKMKDSAQQLKQIQDKIDEYQNKKKPTAPVSVIDSVVNKVQDPELQTHITVLPTPIESDNTSNIPSEPTEQNVETENTSETEPTSEADVTDDTEEGQSLADPSLGSSEEVDAASDEESSVESPAELQNQTEPIASDQ